MEATLRISTTLLAHGDAPATSNPRLRYVDVNRDITQPVRNPQTLACMLSPGESRTVFDGSRTLALDGTTEMSVALVTGLEDRYRFHWDGGTAPGFRTARALDLSGCTVDVQVNNNGTAKFVIAAGPGDFSAVVVGDTLWLPDVQEITTQPFNVGNQGFWVVLSKTSSSVTVTRSGDFEAHAETGIAVAAADQLQSFSAAGVQAGDKLEVEAGFAASTQRTYPVLYATPTYLEVSATRAIAEEDTILPGASGLFAYTAGKSFLRVEVDQDLVVRVNGDTGNTQRISPFAAADPLQVGHYERVGTSWKLILVNLGSVDCQVLVVSVE